MKTDPIFLITVFEDILPYDDFIADLGIIRSVGFCYTFGEADSHVNANACDICETFYKYACIEEIGDGLYPSAKTRWFYKFNINTGRYDRIEEPELVKNIFNIGKIG